MSHRKKDVYRPLLLSAGWAVKVNDWFGVSTRDALPSLNQQHLQPRLDFLLNSPVGLWEPSRAEGRSARARLSYHSLPRGVQRAERQLPSHGNGGLHCSPFLFFLPRPVGGLMI